MFMCTMTIMPAVYVNAVLKAPCRIAMLCCAAVALDRLYAAAVVESAAGPVRRAFVCVFTRVCCCKVVVNAGWSPREDGVARAVLVSGLCYHAWRGGRCCRVVAPER